MTTPTYLPASFKGFVFHVKADKIGFGRQKVVHEVPNRDLPIVEDTGLKNLEASFTGYLLGEDALRKATELIRLIETDRTAGTLVHPLMGELTVEITDSSIQTIFDDRSSNYVELDFQFVRVGKNKFPLENISTTQAVANRSLTVQNTIGGAFQKQFKVAGFHPSIGIHASKLIAQTAKQFSSVLNRVNMGVATANQLIADIDKLKAEAIVYASKPKLLVLQMQRVFAGLLTAIPSPRQARLALQDLAGGFNMLGGVGAIQQSNQASYYRLFELHRLASMAEAISNEPFDSYDQAKTVLQGWVTQATILHQQTADTLDTDSANDLAQLIAETTQQVRQDAFELPRLKSVAIQVPLPALVVAYAEYESIEREADVLTRNSVQHPGFVPVGNIELLSA
jgi:prophage DNA circulation protein